MTTNYKSVFDIIGPVMIGPSSSHTAGAVAIGQVARKVFQSTPREIVVHYFESFAQTHRGHGTDYAIVSGVLGFSPADARVPQAVTIARQQQIKVVFKEEKGKSPIGHPNTAVIQLKNAQKSIEIAGCSIGGGTIEIRRIKVGEFDIQPQGALPVLLALDDDRTDQLLLEQLEVLTGINYHHIYVADTGRQLAEFDLNKRLKQDEVRALSSTVAELIYL
ncbi:serine dehydratase beta chain [Loigolactobacillus iwatensis]|uniref:serine dehydratase beta chain n=1 Tax=Loigolactobacillus iwatensis TaxID=1267156 RepID=UPI000F7F8AC8|nr:serine dehydratase beta chain [Loigolactobacillus iwatensis]